MFSKISLYAYFEFITWHSNINIYHVTKKKCEKWGITDSIIKYYSQHYLGEAPSMNMKPEFKDQALLCNGAILH